MWSDGAAWTLAVVWLFYGALHFGSPLDTVRQIPSWVPWKLFVAYLTGACELGIAGFLIARVTRDYAAWISIGLLAVYVPAVVRILRTDDAFPARWTAKTRAVVRWILVPHNILLAVWAYQLT